MNKALCANGESVMDVNVELQKELIDALAALTREKPFWESPIAVGLLAAFAAISASLLERWQAFRLQERQSEIERQLRIHELQMEALKSLSEIEHSVTPNDEPTPGADSCEWLSPIVYSLSTVIRKLDDYLKTYGYVSPFNVITHIRLAINVANEYKWGVLMSDSPGYDPTSEEIQGVLKLIEELGNAVKHFKACLGVPGA